MKAFRFLRPLALVALFVSLSAAAYAGVFLSVSIGPPPIPVYTQPACPGPGYIFTPGYWSWGDEGYYWVPGTWVEPPQAGLYWTPGYWGWNDGAYQFNDGYWGNEVGFYGGINYGFGYTGRGYEGGEWRGHDFYYNRAVNNVNVTNIRNVYNKTVIVNNHTRVSYNGGSGGTYARPTPQQVSYRRQHHVDPTPMQRQHIEAAARNRELLARNNQGRPPIAATARPNDFKAAVPAKAAGGRLNRAALTATPKTAAPRAATERNAANRPNEAGRPAARTPEPSRATSASRANEPGRTAPKPASESARNANHSVPKPPSASESRHSEPSTAHNTPKPPSASTSTERARANEHVTAPPARGETASHAEKPSAAAQPHRATPQSTRPSVSASSHAPAASHEPRATGMPQSDRALAPHPAAPPAHAATSHVENAPRPAAHEAPPSRPEAHASPRPAEHAAPAHQAAPPSHEPAPSHEAEKPKK